MHPGTKDAPLAHHIIASAYFDQMNGPNRDQTATRKALEQLKILKTRYPDSTYAQDADNRIRIAEDTLAASEMEVGRYYLKQKNYAGAINRFKTVVSDYQTTTHVEEALMRLTECYMALGVKQRGADRRRRARVQLPQLALVQGRLRAAEVGRPRARPGQRILDHQGLEVGAEVLARRPDLRAAFPLNR